MRYTMIYVPKIYGTCGGANKALEMAIKLKEEYKDKNVYIYKEILHNPYYLYCKHYYKSCNKSNWN